MILTVNSSSFFFMLFPKIEKRQRLTGALILNNKISTEIACQADQLLGLRYRNLLVELLCHFHRYN